MNVYDFDGTIYNGNSTVDFILYACSIKPSIYFSLFPTAFAGIAYSMKLISLEQFKKIALGFLKKEENTAELVNLFWKKNIGKIMSWYLRIKRSDDLIISGSPAFLIKHAANMLGVNNVIATEMDPLTLSFSGKNCSGENKVLRYREVFRDEKPVTVSEEVLDRLQKTYEENKLYKLHSFYRKPYIFNSIIEPLGGPPSCFLTVEFDNGTVIGSRTDRANFDDGCREFVTILTGLYWEKRKNEDNQIIRIK
ncbi:MAG: haloacid dehalogenase-like hydrolase [Muribaculaceae bacterium]|nr:haloacid dehalogenase-like hydrolase [Muribaculaceae bacterium]